jgi:hypothetical protein
MTKEYLILILAPLIVWLVWIYQDNKRQAQKLSDRLHNVENNVTQLNNVNYKRRYK